MHKENEEFKTGSIKWLLSDYNVIGYARFTRDNHSAILINNNDYEVTKEVSVWELGIPRDAEMTRLMLTDRNGFTADPAVYPLKAGKVTVTLPPESGIVLQYRDPVREKRDDAHGGSLGGRKNFLQFT